ncbi:hypothetical protein FTO74_10985 [Granulicella sp. WH15]|nr:hypothetical protein FTO74_10985 [Granulicella sp. WH15]
MEILCSQCGAALVCEPEGNCWCMKLPAALPVPEEGTSGCLCPECLGEKLPRPQGAVWDTPRA